MLFTREKALKQERNMHQTELIHAAYALIMTATVWRIAFGQNPNLQSLQQQYNSTSQLVVNVGFVYEPEFDPITGQAALTTAETDMRRNRILPDWVKIRIVPRTGCELESGIAPALDLYYNETIDVLIGPACDSSMIPIARLYSYYNRLIIGYASTSAELSDSIAYPAFIRTSYADDRLTRTVVNTLADYNWLTIGLIRNSVDDCDSFINAISNDLQLIIGIPTVPNVTASVSLTFDFNNLNSDSANTKFAIMRNRARIFVVCPGYTIYQARPFMIKMAEQNMTTDDYLYVIVKIRHDWFDNTEMWNTHGPDDGNNAVAKEAYKRVIVISRRQPSAVGLTVLEQSLLNTMQEKYGRSVQSLNMSTFILNIYDTMAVYGYGLNRSLTQGVNLTDGLQMFRLMANVTVKGVWLGATQNDVIINSVGDRVPTFHQLAVDSTGQMTGYRSVTLMPTDSYGWNDASYTTLRPEFWYYPDGRLPDDQPPCNFDGLGCHNETSSSIIIGVVVAAVIIVVVMGILIAWRMRQVNQERELLKLAWRVERHEIHRISKGKNLKSEDPNQSSISGSSEASASAKSGDSSLLNKQKLENETGILHCNRAVFIGVGDYRDLRIAVKQIRQYQPDASFSIKDLVIINAVREIRHENLNSFHGIVMTPGTPGLVLWSYCQRGSLDDLLFNDHVDLDMMFKSSMMRDLVKGLEYLHKSAVGCHGALNTTNCVVDGRWILKLTDFGLHEILRKLQQPSKSLNEVDDQLYSQSMYHMAPEILKQAFEKRFTVPTREADIYGLGMVLFQILYREQPFTNMTITPAEVIRKIAYPGPSYQILRPTLPKRSAVNHGFSVLLNLCWDEIPSSRPNVSSIKESVYAMSKQYNANIIDHVIKIMEQYTQNLEKVVEERTKELEAERQKADMLLREMLPRTVADDLKAGKSVLPESYESATIYFSDIMHFIQICSTSSPLEVVTMLNLLYSNYDNITKQYDVYKVETIGDAYMVASGLPIRNGVKHVFEIANMALHIRRYVQTEFQIPHRASERLQIRIGFHSGSAAAGVIGLAMPRYCVFGDTVNTASRMESTGEAMKIQVSTATAKFLETRREYLLEKRGLIELKGKGLQETVWLVDRVPVVETM